MPRSPSPSHRLPKSEPSSRSPCAWTPPLPRLYAGYAKGGFGLYTSPFADIHYGETQSRKGSWGVNLVHHSSAGSTGQVDSLGLDEGWSHNVLQGHYKRFIDRSSLTLEGGIQRDAWGIHGLDLSMIDPITFAAPDGRQTYSRVYTSARLQNHQRDSTKVQRDLRLTTSRLTLGLSPVPSNAAMPEILIEPRPGEPRHGHRRVPDLAG